MADAAAEPGWLTISDLARHRGVKKAAMSKRVTRLAARGVLHPKPGRRGTKLVSLEEFETAIAEHGDAIREANGRSALASASSSDPLHPILAKEQAKLAARKAEIATFDLEERRGQLVAVEQCERAVDACSVKVAAVLWRLPGLVEDIIAIGARDGIPAARTFVKAQVRDALAEMGRAMKALVEQREQAGSDVVDQVETSDAAA